MENQIAISGIGIISSLGNGVKDNLTKLLSGSSGIRKAKYFQSIHNERLSFGEVPFSNEELCVKAGVDTSEFYPRSLLLALCAFEEAINDAGISDLSNVAFINATTVGGFDKSEKFYSDNQSGKGGFEDLKYHDTGGIADFIADKYGVKGFVTTISTACSSAANAMILGSKLIESGQYEQVIVGGTDGLTRFTVNGFNSLYILDENLCKPFDQERKGLNLGEAAAYLVMNKHDDDVPDKKVYGFLKGYGNANDAFHQTASSENGEGAYLAMKEAFRKADISLSQIDYINAHGTGTGNNDFAESTAIKRLFEENVPAFSSTKSFTGHTLAAAGAIEAVYSLLAIQEGSIWPNLHFSTSIEGVNLEPVIEKEDKDINYVLSNSFGFGGNCSALIFSKNIDE